MQLLYVAISTYSHSAVQACAAHGMQLCYLEFDEDKWSRAYRGPLIYQVHHSMSELRVAMPFEVLSLPVMLYKPRHYQRRLLCETHLHR